MLGFAGLWFRSWVSRVASGRPVPPPSGGVRGIRPVPKETASAEVLMSRQRKRAGSFSWLRLVVAGLAAVAALATAASGGNGRNVTTDGPARCVVLKVSP